MATCWRLGDESCEDRSSACGVETVRGRTVLHKTVEIICPFCGWHNLFYFRNLAKGVRCSTCRALHMGSHRQAMRDIVPADEAAHVALDGRVEA